MIQKKLYILSADDDKDDQEFIQEALKQTRFDHTLDKVTNGDKLLKFLNEISNTGNIFPDVILIDLNMPVKSGREAIRILKDENSIFKNIPLVVLTTSNAAEDIRYCLKHGALSFLVKPNSFTDLIQILDNTLHKIAETGTWSDANLN